MAISFKMNGLSLTGEWDEVNRSMVIKDIEGELAILTKLLGIKLEIKGDLRTETDNRIHCSVKSVGRLPSFFIPVILKGIRGKHNDIGRIVSVRGKEIVFDRNLGLTGRQPEEPEEAVAAQKTPSGFYARMKERIARVSLELTREITQWVLSVPDLLRLLIKIARDKRVSMMLKLKIVLAVVYIVSPFDVIPEILFGPLGFVDDILIMYLILAELIAGIPPEVIEENWSGRRSVLEPILKGQSLLKKILPGGIAKRLGSLLRIFD